MLRSTTTKAETAKKAATDWLKALVQRDLTPEELKVTSAAAVALRISANNSLNNEEVRLQVREAIREKRARGVFRLWLCKPAIMPGNEMLPCGIPRRHPRDAFSCFKSRNASAELYDEGMSITEKKTFNCLVELAQKASFGKVDVSHTRMMTVFRLAALGVRLNAMSRELLLAHAAVYKTLEEQVPEFFGHQVKPELQTATDLFALYNSEVEFCWQINGNTKNMSTKAEKSAFVKLIAENLQMRQLRKVPDTKKADKKDELFGGGRQLPCKLILA